MTQQAATSGTRLLRTVLILLIVLLAFVASYRIAVAATAGSATVKPAGRSPAGTPARASSRTSGSSACACCGGSGGGARVEGAATIGADGVQRITVDTSNGYDPSVITLTAGVPTEITFKQASGCLGQVVSADLGFSEDLTGGDKTVQLDALQAGAYGFSCGMRMVFGEIVVK